MVRALDVAFVAALSVTLGIKVLTGATAGGAAPSPELNIQRALQQQGFQVGMPEPGSDPPLVPATRGDCRLKVTAVSALGWHRDILARITKPDEVLYFVVGGQVFDEQPRWKTFARYVGHRAIAYAGIPIGPPVPTLGVIAARTCAADAVNWAAFATQAE